MSCIITDTPACRLVKTEEEDVRRYATVYLTEQDVPDNPSLLLTSFPTDGGQGGYGGGQGGYGGGQGGYGGGQGGCEFHPLISNNNTRKSLISHFLLLDRFANLDGGQQSYADSGYGQQAAGGYGGQQQQGGCALLPFSSRLFVRRLTSCAFPLECLQTPSSRVATSREVREEATNFVQTGRSSVVSLQLLSHLFFLPSVRSLSNPPPVPLKVRHNLCRKPPSKSRRLLFPFSHPNCCLLAPSLPTPALIFTVSAFSLLSPPDSLFQTTFPPRPLAFSHTLVLIGSSKNHECALKSVWHDRKPLA